MIGRESYADPVKETWRGWQWNRICERLPEWDNRKMPSMQSAEFRRVAKTKTALYLAGKEAMDLDWAARRGFCLDNMIAIDISEDAVKCVRGRGGIAIRGKLHDVLIGWPKDWHIDIVVADFCGPFDLEIARFANSMSHSLAISTKTVLSINMQRGRDEASNAFRSQVRRKEFQGCFGSVFADFEMPLQEMLKNRAMQFHAWQPLEIAYSCAMQLNHQSPETQNAECADITCFNMLMVRIVRKLLCQFKPEFKSYHRKGSPVFDSAVSRWIIGTKGESFFATSSGPSPCVAKRKPVRDAKRKITAARAVRTMRMN